MTSAGSQYEVKRASLVVLMLSGRYICDFRTRYFDISNPTGTCKLCRSSPAQVQPALQAHWSTSSSSAWPSSLLIAVWPSYGWPPSSPALAPACGAPLLPGASAVQCSYLSQAHVQGSSGQPRSWARSCITAATCWAGHGASVFTMTE